MHVILSDVMYSGWQGIKTPCESLDERSDNVVISYKILN